MQLIVFRVPWCPSEEELSITERHFNPFYGSRPRSPAQTHTRAYSSKTNNINFKNASLHIKLITERGPWWRSVCVCVGWGGGGAREVDRPDQAVCRFVRQPLEIVFFCRPENFLHKSELSFCDCTGGWLSVVKGWSRGRGYKATADSQQLMHSENWRHNLCLQSGLFKENLEHFSPEQQHHQQPEQPEPPVHVLSLSSTYVFFIYIPFLVPLFVFVLGTFLSTLRTIKSKTRWIAAAEDVIELDMLSTLLFQGILRDFPLDLSAILREWQEIMLFDRTWENARQYLRWVILNWFW